MPAPKYLNTAETQVFTKSNLVFGLDRAAAAIRAGQMAVVVEGQFDVISLHLAGFEHAVGMMGSQLSEAQAAALARAGALELVLIPDGDGRTNLARSVAVALAAGIGVRVAELPADTGETKWDPDAVVRSPEHGPEWLTAAIADATDAWMLLCRPLVDVSPTVLEQRAVAELGPIYQTVGQVARETMARQAAACWGVGRRAVAALLAGNPPPKKKAPGPPRQNGICDLENGCTDLANAHRVVRYHGDDVLYCHRSETWWYWDGRRWAEDWRGRVGQLAADLWQRIAAEAADPNLNGHRPVLEEWAEKSQSSRVVHDALRLARYLVPVEREEWDREPHLLNCENGTVDLRSGELRPHDRADRITRMAPAVYDPNAGAALWAESLDTWQLGDESLIGYLQRMAGYSAWGSSELQCVFLNHGSGANGKSTFIDTVASVLGDYACGLAIEALLFRERNSSGPTPELARLDRVRMVNASEPEEGVRLAEGLIKRATGDEPMPVRKLREDTFDLRPEFSLWLSMNHLPQIRGVDDGIWRRMRYIPWRYRVPDAEIDTRFKERFRPEWGGILTWIVQGAKWFYEQGEAAPEEVRSATAAARAKENVVGRFLDECCVLEPHCWVKASDLHTAYENWAKGAEPEMKANTFGRRMTDLGFQRGRTSVGGQTTYEGVGLREG